ncbi:transposase [Streptosporangium sp. NPDC049078]|uniref:transposase n=1 Tax=Streptosporangium sp. NPDC049078 TaxID=3155767 RepID=UPI00343EB787
MRPARGVRVGCLLREKLPHAAIVVDHFHLIALAGKALTGVRRRVTREERGRRGRATGPEWANRLIKGTARVAFG